jgi:hypothetical protein
MKQVIHVQQARILCWMDMTLNKIEDMSTAIWAIILLVYGCETWYFFPRKEQRSGLQGDEVT